MPRAVGCLRKNESKGMQTSCPFLLVRNLFPQRIKVPIQHKPFVYSYRVIGNDKKSRAPVRVDLTVKVLSTLARVSPTFFQWYGQEVAVSYLFQPNSDRLSITTSFFCIDELVGKRLPQSCCSCRMFFLVSRRRDVRLHVEFS
jgi:hypothetical protein